MTSTIADLFPFTKRRADGQPGIDHAIARLDLLRQIRERRAGLARLHERHADELADAEMYLGMVELALVELERHEGRAP